MTTKSGIVPTSVQTQKLFTNGLETKQESKQSRNRNKAGKKIIYKRLEF